MKHKFRPSVGSNRSRRGGGAATGGGGRSTSESAADDSSNLLHTGCTEQQEQQATNSPVQATTTTDATAPSTTTTTTGQENREKRNDQKFPEEKGEEEDKRGSETGVEESTCGVEKAANKPQVPPTSSSSTTSVRLRKKVAPIVKPGRPRSRPRPTAARNSVPESQELGGDQQFSNSTSTTATSTSGAIINSSTSSSYTSSDSNTTTTVVTAVEDEGPPMSDNLTLTGVGGGGRDGVYEEEASVRDNLVQEDYVRDRECDVTVEERQTEAQPHSMPQTNQVNEDEGKRKRTKVCPTESLGQRTRENEARTSDGNSSGGCDGNLSGVLRSSLDLVCPPPSKGEGGAFESGEEERNGRKRRRRRGTRQCAASEEEEENISIVQQEEGQLRNEGEREEDAPGRRDGGEGGGERQVLTPARDTATRGSEAAGKKQKRKSRKRQSQNKGTTESEQQQQGTKKRRTGAGGGGGGGGGGGSRTPNKVREAPDRTSMTMQELIYYNPSANPMSSSVEGRRRHAQENEENPVEQDDSMSSSRASSRVQTPAPLASDASSEISSVDQWTDTQDSGRIVPQLRMGKDGNIILDEDSMVVAATARRLPYEEDPLNPPLEEGFGHTTSASYRKSGRVTRWTREETTKFFRALSQVGTDFTMMTLLLPKRSRKELKNKFKKEEKSNPHRVSQALKNQMSVRPSQALQSTTASSTTTPTSPPT